MKGIIAAIATPIGPDGEPDHRRFIAHAQRLISSGCDALNVLGTTGEATSLSIKSRRSLMKIAAAELPRDRLMVGIGAAALSDVTELASAASEFGFAAALVLPPFYYKDVSDDGLHAFVSRLIENKALGALPLYLYNFPQMTGIVWSIELIQRLKTAYGCQIAGLKDSSGDLNYARQLSASVPDFAVFPSNEATLSEARTEVFAGCISATANLNSSLCAAAYHHGNEEALKAAVAIRTMFQGLPLVAAIKAVLADLSADAQWSVTVPPLQPICRANISPISKMAREFMP
jgi:4-hydroxy-tetrahydrodipicolinate synthase